jgi:sugar lactone lactonase YvrE
LTAALAAALCLLAGPSHSWAQALPVQLVPAITTIAGDGTQGYTGDGQAGTSAELYSPFGVAADNAGNVYIADFEKNVIRKVTPDGKISTIAGNGHQGYLGDGGPAANALLDNPGGVAVDSAGNVYIADTGNSVIRTISASTGNISTYAGNGTAGHGGDGGPATSAELNLPYGMAFDGAGNLYIADTQSERIREVFASNHYIATIAGGGSTLYTASPTPATSALLQPPVSVAVDRRGNVYFPDSFHHVIREVSGGNVYTFAGNGSQGNSGDGHAAISAELDSPYGVVLDAASNLYISDSGNNNIRMVSASTGNIVTFAGTGTGGFAGDGGPAILGEFKLPFGIGMDPAGILYVADSTNYRVRKISTASFPTTAVGSTSISQNVLFQLNVAQSITSITAGISQGSQQEYKTGTITGCTVNGTTSNSGGAICTIPIIFNPAYPGLRGVPLTAITSLGTFTFGLTGVGTGPQVAFTPGIISTIAGGAPRRAHARAPRIP